MKISDWGKVVSGINPKNAFLDLKQHCTITNDDGNSFVRIYIFEGIPHFLIDRPFVYDKIRLHIAENLDVLPRNIGLTGSAKIGFSLAPYKWLRDFSPENSDLDFFIVDELMFNKICSDFFKFKADVNSGMIKYQTVTERRMWNASYFENIEKNIGYGFIDTIKVPNRLDYRNALRCNRVIEKIADKIGILLENKDINHKNNKSSIRCYRNHIDAIRRMTFNICQATKKIQSETT